MSPVAPLSFSLFAPKSLAVAGAASLVTGYIPVALSKSEGAGSVVILVSLPGAHLYIQVLGNAYPRTVAAVPATRARKNRKTSEGIASEVFFFRRP